MVFRLRITRGHFLGFPDALSPVTAVTWFYKSQR